MAHCVRRQLCKKGQDFLQYEDAKAEEEPSKRQAIVLIRSERPWWECSASALGVGIADVMVLD